MASTITFSDDTPNVVAWAVSVSPEAASFQRYER